MTQIPDLTEITTLADDDLLVTRDLDAAIDKKITWSSIKAELNLNGTHSDTQVLFNDSGVISGHSGLTYDGAGQLTLGTRLVAPVWRPASDSTTALQMQTASGTAVLTVDTTNSRWVLNGDLMADRYLNDQTNLFLGVDSAGRGNMASGASKCTGIGYQALYSLTTGFNNVNVGYQSGRANTTGALNTAIGTETLLINTTGSYNGAFGNSALRNNTGSYNNAQGARALYKNTTGDFNTGVGAFSLYGNTTGNSLIGVGYEAGRYIASGAANATSSNSIYIGNDARAATAGNTNQIVIGHEAIGEGSNTTVLGNNSCVSTTVKGNLHVKYVGNLAVNIDIGTGVWLDSSVQSRQVGRLLWRYTNKTDATRVTEGALTAYYIGTEHKAIRWRGGSGGPLLSFYDVTTPIARQTLATGAGASVDDVISALQNLGLVKQS